MNLTVNGKKLSAAACARPVLAHFLARSWLVRRQERLRSGRLRRLHCLHRRQAVSLLSGAGVSRRGARNHDHRGARQGRRTASDAAGVSRRASVSMRLLRRRNDHDRRPRSSEEDRNDFPRMLKGNLCRCTGYHSIDDALHGVVNVETDIAGEACGRSIRNPFAEGIVTGQRANIRSTFCRWTACCT